MEEGLPLMIENMGEHIDAVLDQMVARAFTKKGSKLGKPNPSPDPDPRPSPLDPGPWTLDPGPWP